jgi:ribonucleoside-triphosphate reductase
VEGIQDSVEKVLFDTAYFNTAKAYILYREQHAQIRAIAAIASANLVDSYLNKLDWKVNENSNMAYSLQGLNNYISSDITSKYWLNRIYPPEIRKAHENGEIHIHDLDLLSVYCVGWDLKDLLVQGFKGVEGKVESAPPKHLRSALGQIVNFFYTLQGEAAGAQAFSNFDTLLAAFIHYDNLNYKEVKQALQEFVFNINIPTRVGFQTPFTNITLDLRPPDTLKNQPVIIGGIEQESTYSEFQSEMDMLNCALAEVMLEGDAKGRVFTFPIPTYNITADFDWDNPRLDKIWQMAGKYGIPYFSNFVNSDLSPDDAVSMCCRLRLDKRELIKRGGGLFGANPLTGSIGVVTINLPRIGYLSANEIDFFEHLEKIVLLAAESLSIKRKVLEKFTDKKLYPYSTFYLRSIKQATGYYWKHHFSTIGIIGMNEACLNLLGTNIADKAGLEFSLRVMDFIRGLIAEMQEKSDTVYNLEATPAEGASYHLALLDKKKFPEILCANDDEYQMGASPFYTNSTQLPVNYTDDIFETLTLQDDLQTKYTGGTVLHIYLGEQVSDSEVLKQLIQKIVSNFRLPYFTITPTFSVCPDHGYLNGKQIKCRVCDKDTEIYSRVVGYLRPIKQWNDGKQAEFRMRKAFNMANTNKNFGLRNGK